MKRFGGAAWCLFLGAVLILSFLAARPAGSATLEDSHVDTFRQGRFHGVALDSRGYLELAPELTGVAAPGRQMIWCTVSGDGGAWFAGCGNEGLVLKVTEQSKVEQYYQTGELGVLSLLPLENGELLAGTAPNGLLVRISEKEKGSILAETGASYIWCLMKYEDKVLAGTGPEGKVLQIDQDGTVEELARVEEHHVLCMTAGKSGTVYLGVSGTGTVYTLKPETGIPRVLARLARADIRVLKMYDDGEMLAVAAGGEPRDNGAPDGDEEMGQAVPEERGNERKAGAGSAAPDGKRIMESDGESAKYPGGHTVVDVGQKKSVHVEVPGRAQEVPGRAPEMSALEPDPTVAEQRPGREKRGPEEAETSPVQSPDEEPSSPPDEGGGEEGGAPSMSGVTGEGAGVVYCLTPDGLATVLAEFNEMILAAAPGRNGSVIAGGAEKGRIYQVDRDGTVKYLGRTDAEQVMDIRALPDGRLLAATGNPGELWLISASPAESGTYTSRVLDSGGNSYWGAFYWVGSLPDGATVVFSTRTGRKPRPDDTWNPWGDLGAESGEKVLSEPGRYLQYRLKLNPSPSGESPSVHRLTFHYRKPNQAPRMKPPTVSFQAPSPPGGNNESPPPYMAEIAWEATDADEDPLQFDVELVSLDHHFAYPMTRDSISQTSLTWDFRGVPDGWYQIRVTASDRVARGVSAEGTGDALSTPFKVDNTPPVVTLETAAYDEKTGKWSVTVSVEDRMSRIHGIRVSLDGEQWEMLASEDELFDGPSETAVWQGSVDKKDKTDPKNGKDRHSLVVQGWDEKGNVGAGATVFP